MINVQNPVDIPLKPDWFIGILIMAYYNPHITGWYNPLYTLNNQGQGFFIAQMESWEPL